VKLPLRESELDALLHALAEWEGYISSTLLGVEAIRACGRYGGRYSADARSFLVDVALVPIDDLILAEAASIGPTLLRSLDALHLATALSVREEIGAFVTYDRSLAEAAEARGMAVLSPALS
jgi:predicted nucleic acid-binding protein